MGKKAYYLTIAIDVFFGVTVLRNKNSLWAPSPPPGKEVEEQAFSLKEQKKFLAKKYIYSNRN